MHRQLYVFDRSLKKLAIQGRDKLISGKAQVQLSCLFCRESRLTQHSHGFNSDFAAGKSSIALAILLIWFIFTGSASAQSISTNIEFTEIIDGVYVRYGRHEEINADSVADIANHGFIVGDTSVAIIDPGGTVAVARQTVAAVKEITSKPVTHVIVSHVHPDHSLGLAAYVDGDLADKPVIAGHPGLAASLLQNLDFFKQRFASDDTTDQLLKLIEAGQIESIDQERTFDLGNRKITLTAFNNAHSSTDVTVYDQKTKTLWSGDLLFVERTPAVDGSIVGWIKALNELSQLDITTVIPGHGPSGLYSELAQPQLDYLTLVVDQARDAIAQGISLANFISNNSYISAHSQSKWKLFDTQHAVNLSRAYVELEWE